jgi:hypothetical protein
MGDYVELLGHKDILKMPVYGCGYDRIIQK